MRLRLLNGLLGFQPGALESNRLSQNAIAIFILALRLRVGALLRDVLHMVGLIKESIKGEPTERILAVGLLERGAVPHLLI